jgi:hypothetical protein
LETSILFNDKMEGTVNKVRGQYRRPEMKTSMFAEILL